MNIPKINSYSPSFKRVSKEAVEAATENCSARWKDNILQKAYEYQNEQQYDIIYHPLTEAYCLMDDRDRWHPILSEDTFSEICKRADEYISDRNKKSGDHGTQATHSEQFNKPENAKLSTKDFISQRDRNVENPIHIPGFIQYIYDCQDAKKINQNSNKES